jgi:hypothetical protein
MKTENQHEQILKAEKQAAFDFTYQQALAHPGSFIEYTLPYPKHEFLDFLVATKDVVLHGSSHSNISELKPQLANCKSKKFGNLNGVYATGDSVLPIFYAIQNEKKLKGQQIDSGYWEQEGKKTYNFAVSSKEVLDSYPWSDGVIYILPRKAFEQGTNNEGHPIDEFISRVPVTPIAKLRVAPEDFDYLNQVQIKEESIDSHSSEQKTP